MYETQFDISFNKSILEKLGLERRLSGLRTLTALKADQSSIPSTHTVAQFQGI